MDKDKFIANNPGSSLLWDILEEDEQALGKDPAKRGIKTDYGFAEPVERPFDTSEATT